MRLAFLLTLLAAAIAADSATAVATTIYQLLEQHGLPTGILPKGIMEYTADPATGFFEVRLARPCNAEFENQLHYDFNVSGQLSFGKIGELSGVSQQELFLWFPVKGIRVDVPSSGLIYFDVGVVDKQFSLSLFESPRDCTAADPDDGRSADTSSFNDPSQNQHINLGFKNGQGGSLRAVS
ncbi:hypothetical protein LWI29_013326 [Acer saccharum]|uniref:DUF538 family protein n=1 Tax=Acer saccharum TaxID=4024 RepID=A0AA39SIM7_ACESA|nr:hypothetical protein LWI29_013326 [Acer saccharum]KAK1572263.1 hypothetical protein Q3G72_029816 [Acer saccharum]